MLTELLAGWPLFILHSLLQILFLVRALIRPGREPSSRIAWVLVIISVPALGMLAYVFFGETRIGWKREARYRAVFTRLRQSRSARQEAEAAVLQCSEPLRHLFRFGHWVSGFAARSGNSARILEDSDTAIDALVADIDAARDHVHLLFYIWLQDTNGTRVAEAAMRAARRGVTVRAMADDVGSRRMVRSRLWAQMGEAGVKLAAALPVSNPLLHPIRGRVDLRNHRKIMVIDGAITYCGSQNCADPAFLVKAKYGPWVDLMLRFEGPVARQNQALFAADWMAHVDEDLTPLLEPAEEQTPEQDLALGHGIAQGPDVATGHGVATGYGVVTGHALAAADAAPSGQAVLPGQEVVADQGVAVGQDAAPGHGAETEQFVEHGPATGQVLEHGPATGQGLAAGQGTTPDRIGPTAQGMATGGIVAQVIGTGPNVHANAMPEMFELLIHAARDELVLTTPYYVPTEAMQSALCAAGRRGVRCTLIFPARNDSWIVAAASRSYYAELLDARVRIFEYPLGLLHAKSLTLDGHAALVGSANLDRRSFELNYENNILLEDTALTGALRARQQSYVAASREVLRDEVARWSVPRRLWYNFIAMFGPVL